MYLFLFLNKIKILIFVSKTLMITLLYQVEGKSYFDKVNICTF